MLQRLYTMVGFTYFAGIGAVAVLLVCIGHLLNVLRTPAIFEKTYADSVLFTLDKGTVPLDKIIRRGS